MSRIIDIEAVGITCGDCSFNCDLEDVLDHFSIQNKERAEKKYRSGYSSSCRKCTCVRSQTNYRKRRLASNPDYKPNDYFTIGNIFDCNNSWLRKLKSNHRSRSKE